MHYNRSKISRKSQTPDFPASHSPARTAPDAKPRRISDRRFNVGLSEVVAFEKQRLGADLGQRVGETIAEVETCRVALALSIDVECLESGTRLLLRYWND